MLTKFFNYLFRRIKSDGFKSFIHFFATFSGIFLIMTVMILQILSYGVYSNVDSSLKMAATKTNSYLEMEMLKRELFLTSVILKIIRQPFTKPMILKSRQLKHLTRVALKKNLEEIKN